MSKHPSDDHLKSLIAEINELAAPRSLGHVIREATGTLFPGFTALPAVTILANDTWKTRAFVEAECWATGDLLALAAIEEGEGSHGAFFTPVGETIIPLVDATRLDESSPLACSYELKPRDRWEQFEMQFALLPRDVVSERPGWDSETMSSVVSCLEPHVRELRVGLEIDDKSMPLDPQWGMTASALRPSIESLRFPTNYAWQLLAPLVFRLRFSPQELAADYGVCLERQPVRLLFDLPEEALRRAYREAGVGTGDRLGIIIYANAVPLMNVDLRAWPVGDAYGDFIRSTGMKPLGVAGVYPYKKAGTLGDVQPLSSRAAVFSVEIDREGKAITRYELPGVPDAAKAYQLMMWMTFGPNINGERYRCEAAGVEQPLARTSQMLNKLSTIMPCFGGADCFESIEKDLYANLMLNVSLAPQMFAYRDGIHFAVRDLLQKLGYFNVTVDGPRAELRIVEGLRQRVVVVSLVNTSGRRIAAGHLRAVQSYVRERAALGTQMVVEEVL